jgi:hypothetical protein
MNYSPESRLKINFKNEVEKVGPVELDLSSLIPASMIGNVLASMSELMRSTWDYAFTNTNDERFIDLRRLEAEKIIQRKDIELVIVATRPSSLEVILDWAALIYGVGIVQSTLQGVLPNALWDLMKYSFGAIRQLLIRRNEIAEVEHFNEDKLINHILPDVLDIARYGFRENENGRTTTKISYHDSDGSQFEFTVDRQTQQFFLDTNLVETKVATRLVGIIEGVNWRKKSITVRWDLFPEFEIACDIDGLDLREINHLLPRYLGQVSKPLGFDVELAWRRGVANVFPPDAIRIIGIVPDSELLNLNYKHPEGLKRPSIIELENITLSNDEIRFLNWFDWADAEWVNPNINGVVKYLVRNTNIFNRNIDPEELMKLIQRLVKLGIILQGNSTTKRGNTTQILRLNRNHPVIPKYNIIKQRMR